MEFETMKKGRGGGGMLLRDVGSTCPEWGGHTQKSIKKRAERKRGGRESGEDLAEAQFSKKRGERRGKKERKGKEEREKGKGEKEERGKEEQWEKGKTPSQQEQSTVQKRRPPIGSYKVFAKQKSVCGKQKKLNNPVLCWHVWVLPI